METTKKLSDHLACSISDAHTMLNRCADQSRPSQLRAILHSRTDHLLRDLVSTGSRTRVRTKSCSLLIPTERAS